MSDNEIIKALDICNKAFLPKCSECPCNGVSRCSPKLRNDTFALINRQKAEIERLKEELFDANEGVEFYKANFMSKCEESGKIKSEAIKEFAERLKKHFETYADDEESNAIYMRNLIDDLVEEMTEKGGDKE